MCAPRPRHRRRRAVGRQPAKFVIGREVLGPPARAGRQPAHMGVDAGAAAAIRQALLDLAAAGAGVIVISQDLDELLELSDRFCALNEGRLSPPRPTEGLTVAEIGLMLGGAHGMEVAHVPALNRAVAPRSSGGGDAGPGRHRHDDHGRHSVRRPWLRPGGSDPHHLLGPAFRPRCQLFAPAASGEGRAADP